MNITIIDYSGTEQTGNWNGKTYSSKVSERPELARVYLDNTEVHVDKDVLAQASGISKTETDFAAAKKHVYDFSFYSDIEKLIMLQKLLADPFCRHMVSHARPEMNHLVFTAGEKQIKVNSLDELYLLDESIIRDIMTREEKNIDMGQYMPEKEEE
nr:MAG TPA: hypothetical protein [Caudoviricetes sp.]